MWAWAKAAGKFGASVGLGWVGAAACYNQAYPLNVVWDLDETLVSSSERPVPEPKPGKERVLRLCPSRDVEHLDDDGLHFVTTVRPHALFVLRWLRALPGCQQYVSTSASPGYMKNVLALLDPQHDIFSMSTAGQSSRGKRVQDAMPPGCDTELRRTVLVDNRASCHGPQPGNGIVVTDFVQPPRELVILGFAGEELGRFPAAVAGCSNAGTSSSALLQPTTLGTVLIVGGARGGQQIDTSGAAHATAVASVTGGATERALWAVAERRSAPLRRLAEEAHSAGAAALAVFDLRREQSCFSLDSAGPLPLPVVAVGAAAGRVLQAAALTGGSARTSVVEAADRELLRVLRLLLLGWLLPDVRWALLGCTTPADKSRL